MQHGVYFEITYASLIMDAQLRRQMISSAKVRIHMFSIGTQIGYFRIEPMIKGVLLVWVPCIAAVSYCLHLLLLIFGAVNESSPGKSEIFKIDLFKGDELELESSF